jgi:NAD(P)-dependent dehydrogenase (short-subunit alcohol dehydrogenase family)
MRTILITGCSSGIGWHCALGMKARGWRVLATARKPEDLARLEAEGVAETLRRTGGKLDALFNNGAYGQPGAVEDLSREVLEAQFAANVFGWHQLTRECLPLMRANGAGRIVQCSSVLGLVALKWRGAYNASKFAIEALSDTMRLELRGTNIFVSLIEPGPITSRFVETSLKNFEKNIDESKSHYGEAYARQRARLGRGGSARYKLGPDAVLEKLVHAVESPRPQARYFVTKPTLYMAIARRLLPQRLLDRVLDKASDQ